MTYMQPKNKMDVSPPTNPKARIPTNNPIIGPQYPTPSWAVIVDDKPGDAEGSNGLSD
jgi:hypothetical protein